MLHPKIGSKTGVGIFSSLAGHISFKLHSQLECHAHNIPNQFIAGPENLHFFSFSVHFIYLLLLQVWDRRKLSESNPKPVGMFAGHTDGITHVCPKVTNHSYMLSTIFISTIA